MNVNLIHEVLIRYLSVLSSNRAYDTAERVPALLPFHVPLQSEAIFSCVHVPLFHVWLAYGFKVKRV